LAASVVVMTSILALSGLASGQRAAAGSASTRTTRVSVAPDGSQVKRSSGLPVISGDGRFVAFSSKSGKLVPGDTNKTTDVFVWDRDTGTTERVSVGSTGEQAEGISTPTSISPNGRFVVFTSDAPNLVENDGVPTNLEGALDVFVHDRETNETERISVNAQGEPALYAPSFGGKITPDGRYVAFGSAAPNLDPLDTDGNYDIFVRDRELGTTEMVSLTSTGEETPFMAFSPSISADGRFVAFDANDELTPDDTNRAADVFVRDRSLGTTTLVSVRTDGSVGRAGGVSPDITSDGRFVLFHSDSKLVTADTNRVPDAYLRDLQTGRTSLVSRNHRGRVGNGLSLPNDISDDGRYVLFVSMATNIVREDTNEEFDHFIYDRSDKTVARVNLNNRGRQARGDKGFNILATMSDDGAWVALASSAYNLVPSDTNNTYDIFLRGPFPSPSVARTASSLPAVTVPASAAPTCFGKKATIVGTNRDPLKSDELNGTGGNDVIVSLAGSDVINGRAGDDLICGGGGDDLIKAGAGNDKVKGGGLADTIYGGGGHDRLWGGGRSDALNGGPGNDRLFGGPGYESLMGGPGDDLMDGGADYDTAEFWDSPRGIQADLRTNTATGQGQDRIESVEGLVGSDFDDVLFGNDLSNDLQSGAGDDMVYALGSDGDGGIDILRSAGGINVLDGGPGQDIVSYNITPWAVAADLSAGIATYETGTDTLIGIEHLTGSKENDTLIGNDEDNIIFGNAGDDTMDGRGGIDEVAFDESRMPVTADLGAGTADADWWGSDTFVNFENLAGSAYSDTLIGDGGDNLIRGWGRNDILVGLGGNDVLLGFAGTDDADGGDGIDECEAEVHNCEVVVPSATGALAPSFSSRTDWRSTLLEAPGAFSRQALSNTPSTPARQRGR
jgi:Tol biopolymer transport system component